GGRAGELRIPAPVANACRVPVLEAAGEGAADPARPEPLLHRRCLRRARAAALRSDAGAFPVSDRILATYRIAASESESRVRAEALAAEQSVEMPVGAIDDKRILAGIVATVESIKPHAGEFDVVLGIAPATTGNEAS